MPTELDAIRGMNFDWAMHLDGVWKQPSCDIPELQHRVRDQLNDRLRLLATQQSKQSPLGWIVTGSGGGGKTHLLNFLRQETHQRFMSFVLVDMTDVHSFWETVLLGYLDSLHQPTPQGHTQHEAVLQRIFKILIPSQPADLAVAALASASLAEIRQFTTLLLNALHRLHPGQTLQHQHVIRAFVAMHSGEFSTAGLALSWLQGHAIDEKDLHSLGMSLQPHKPLNVVRGLSWFMSVAGPTVLALDQLDPIVTQLNIAAQGDVTETTPDEILTARSIIEGISGGLGALRDVASRTFVVVSCLETTWRVLADEIVLKTNLDRFEPPRTLTAINQGVLAESLVRGRTADAFEQAGFTPPYDTWPFRKSAFQDIQGMSPRQLLKLCHQHCQHCLSQGKVIELERFTKEPAPTAVSVSNKSFENIDATFNRHREEADLGWLLDEKLGDVRLAPLLPAAYNALVYENPPSAEVDAVVDTQFGEDLAKCSLHARLRLCYNHQGAREEHFCLRALQHDHANAFQARLKAAMTQAGIDRRLNFRRLSIIRTTELPGGPVTKELLTRFTNSGGLLLHPTDSEIRTLWALWKLQNDKPEDLAAWLRERKPASQLHLMQQAAPALCPSAPKPADFQSALSDNPIDATPPTDQHPTHEKKSSPKDCGASQEVRRSTTTDQTGHGQQTNDLEQTRAPNASAAAPEGDHSFSSVAFGKQLIGKTEGNPVHVTVGRLSRHSLVMAGSGAGKTVLVRHLVEEAALQGIPSIVIDCANDLATLGDKWPSIPSCWDAEQREKAKQYFRSVETVVWTPGLAAGNPLRLAPLPDLGAVSSDPDELHAAVSMVVSMLGPIVAPGKAMKAKHKRGVLHNALKYFARHSSGTLRPFVKLLSDLPPTAGLGLANESKLASEMADTLCAEMAMNPLLGGTGEELDPLVLFGDTPGQMKTRVSVINFAGLPGLESQRSFLNQLAMTLFAWIKRHPKPPRNRALRGLLVIDEAKDFIPSVKATICKESFMQLTAQARKYGLGIVFATQNPCDIESKIVGNCSVKCFGKANGPAAIKVIKEQLKNHGAAANDVAKLDKGTFYLCGVHDNSPPTKICVPLCLSHHRSALTKEQIVKRAAASRQPANGSGTPTVPSVNAAAHSLEAPLSVTVN